MKPYSHSRLTDLNYCPTWGVVHSQRVYSATARALALEAGGAMHAAFAAVRTWQLGHRQKLMNHMHVTGHRIFGEERWDGAVAEAERISGVKPGARCRPNQEREYLIALAFHILNTTEYEDDPADSRRTMTNFELATIGYIDQRLEMMDSWSIFVMDERDPYAPVGIEWPFDIVLTYSDHDEIRIIGTIDGLAYNHMEDKYYLDENKTASRTDEAWSESFRMSHQVTGYMVAVEAIFGLTIRDAHVFGTPFTGTANPKDQVSFPVDRTDNAITHWSLWVRSTVTLDRTYNGEYEYAPRYTHSCNRYFRPCALIPFCTDTPEGRAQQFDEMDRVIPSPSERAIFSRYEDRDDIDPEDLT